MYLGTNNPQQLSGVFSKLRKAVHKLIPRELSPMLMIKHSKAQAAKVKALETQVSETQRQAANEVQNVKTDAQVKILQAQSLPSATTPGGIAPGFSIPTPTQQFPLTEFVPSQSTPVAPLAPTAPSSAVAPTDNTALYVGLGAAGLLGLFFFMGKRK